MRIRRLEISSFKNLRDFTVDFDAQSFTTVIVGENGAGKSNVLEALVIILRDLDLYRDPEFGYRLEYTCREHNITVVGNPHEETKSKKTRIEVDGNSLSFSKFARESRDEYLPKYVFGYYSGPSNRLEEHFELHQQRFYKALLDGDENASRPLLYARHAHSQFVLLGFFNEHDQTILDFLREYLRIEAFDSVLFVMATPSWYQKGIEKRNTDGDPRFWYARGTVKTFLGRLYDSALAPMRKQIDRTTEHLYLYLPNLETLQRLYKHHAGPQGFFKALESTYISELISEVRIRVKIRNSDQSLTFRELSEGEQQLLMVLGLLRFTKEDESLFLLDEPDTHLNPAWSISYLDHLRSVVGEDPSNQIIMTTHDPLVISGLGTKDVRILELDRESGNIRVVPPSEAPVGMGYADILTSDIFKLRSTVNPKIQQMLDEKRSLAVKDDLSQHEQRRLAELSEQLGDLDITSTVRDPLYKPFVEALSLAEQEEGLQSTKLTKQEQERRAALAREIIARLRAAEETVS
jgi:predicted ATPase